MRALAVVVALASVAHADPEADALTEQGETLARDGDYTRAIDAFKRADARAPSAKHACLIGLAYTRRELWPQAEIWLDRCKLRANPADPLPDWFEAAETQLSDKLKSVDTAALVIRVTPADTPALISISSFPPDETFAPRTVHLGPGTYLVTGTVPGQPPATETVVVKLGADNVVTLQFKEPEKPKPLPPPRVAVERSTLPRYLIIGGGVLAAAGVGFHVLAVRQRSSLQDANDANDQAAWHAHDGAFTRDRAIAIACYGAAALAIGVGIVLRTRDEHGPTVTGTLTSGGAMIGLAVQR